MSDNHKSGQGRGNRKQGSKRSGDNHQSAPDAKNQGGRKRKKNRKKPRLDPVRYWGDAGALPVRDDYALESKDPTAVIRSLGKAPIPGKNSAPELYFDVLYARAAGLAQALAFAGGLNENAVTGANSATPGDSSGGASSGGTDTTPNDRDEATL